jgi:hypothetical protein
MLTITQKGEWDIKFTTKAMVSLLLALPFLRFINIQSGREVTVHRPIRYHNVI